jgi:hypothetical protein
LSAVFKSSTTHKWKVAITIPLYDTSSDDHQFQGILAMTINVGDFAIFRSRQRQTDYFAVLIDNRPGERHGTILQHPLFQEQPPADDYKVSEDQLQAVLSRAVFDYQDPIGQAPGGGAYAGDWIAAAEPVHLPGGPLETPGAENGTDTDLLVLVQVSVNAATTPVKQLGRRLAFDGLSAMIVVVVVVVGLWLVVLRFSREHAGRRSPSTHKPSAGPTPVRTATTLPVIQPPRHRS